MRKIEELFPAIVPYLPYLREIASLYPSDSGIVYMFIAQIAHESGHFKRLEENLKYSPTRLAQVFPKYYPEPVEANPEEIANKVYGGRMGNNKLDDGWRFRGRGLIQITGKNNYKALSSYWELSLSDTILRLGTPEGAVSSAWWFWKLNGIDKLKTIEAVTRKVNGGIIGLNERKALYEKVKQCSI